MFEFLPTGIDGLDALLGGGIRFPEGTAAFLFVTGETGTGKTLLGLELLTRSWWRDDEGGRTFLFYSVEQGPWDLHKKLVYDFGGYFGAPRRVRVVDLENPHTLCLETDAPSGGTNRLIFTQCSPRSDEGRSLGIDIEWIQAEVSNYDRAGEVGVVCIDNVSLLLTDLEYFEKRRTLLETRNFLMRKRVHGIFLQEEGTTRDHRFPSAEELSTDILIRLGFLEMGGFKARVLEILKARHQYYYRGTHHFSIAGKGVNRERYLGARGERGPGVHVYPSVPAQLSIARDTSQLAVPERGDTPISLGVSELDDAFSDGSGPTRLSSTILLAEPGTRYTRLALAFLSRATCDGEAGLLVSTKEDEDAVRRICANDERLRDFLTDSSDGGAGGLVPLLRLLYLHPEYLSAGKFISDILRMSEADGHVDDEPQVTRLAFDNIYELYRRFPLLEGQDFLVPALLDLLRYREITPLCVDLAPHGPAPGELAIDPAMHLTTFDNVFHVYLRQSDEGTQTCVRILKSIGNDFENAPFTISL